MEEDSVSAGLLIFAINLLVLNTYQLETLVIVINNQKQVLLPTLIVESWRKLV